MLMREPVGDREVYDAIFHSTRNAFDAMSSGDFEFGQFEKAYLAAIDLGLLEAMVDDGESIFAKLNEFAALVQATAEAGSPLDFTVFGAALPSILSACGRPDLSQAYAAGSSRIAYPVNGLGAPGSVFIAPPGATHALVLDEGEDVKLLLVPLSQDIAPSYMLSIDGRLRQRIDIWPDGGDVLATGAQAREMARRMDDLCTVLSCIEACALMGKVVSELAAYLNERVQFGKPISSFQVARHRVVDMFVQYQTVRALLKDLVRELAEKDGTGCDRSIALAKIKSSDAGLRIMKEAIQGFGGIGLTEELRAIRSARRLGAMGGEFQTADRSLEMLLA